MKKQEETRQQEFNAKAAEFEAMQAQAETVSSVRSQVICTVCIFLAEFCDSQTVVLYSSSRCLELGHAIITVLIVENR